MTVASDPGSSLPRQESPRPSEGLAVTFLSIYVGILWGVPSAQTIGVLGSLGAPSVLWGFVCLAHWAWGRVQNLRGQARPLQPVRIAYLAFFAVVWLSFSFAQSRALPAGESSPSVTGLLRTLSLAGVLLLAHDGLTTKTQLVTLVRRITLFGGLMALLGLAQFASGHAFIDQIRLPGFTVNEELLAVMGRSGFVRANATAAHPLEFAVVLAGILPLSMGQGLAGVRRGLIRSWWIPLATGLACLLSSSRSAIIGFGVGVVAMLPALSWRGRLRVGGAIGLGLIFVYLTVPGMLGSLSGLFLSQDASTASRTKGLSVALDVAANHPIIGRGFGTFLPRYYILDNQLALLLIEVGVLGLLAFLLLVTTAMVQSQRARRAAADRDTAVLAHSLTASVAASSVLFAFFDAFSFRMAAGTVALLIGMSGAIYNIVEVTPANSEDGHCEDRPWGQARRRGQARHSLGPARMSSFRRFAGLAVVAVLGALVTAGCWAVIMRAPPVYLTTSTILIVDAAVSDREAYFAKPEGDLVPFAGAVERVANDGRIVTRLNSDEASLHGLGVREGTNIHLLNEGGQWAPLFPRPILVVETVASTPEAALAANEDAKVAIQTAMVDLQNSKDVPIARQARAAEVLAEPAVIEVAAARREQLMALIASGLVIALVTAGGLVLLHNRQAQPRP